MASKDWKLTEEDYYWKHKSGKYLTILANDVGTNEHRIILGKVIKNKTSYRTLIKIVGYEESKKWAKAYMRKH